MTKGGVAALWVVTAAVFMAAQISSRVGGTTAYYTASVSGSITGTVGAPPPPPDTTGPVFTAPADQTVEATGPTGAVATYATPVAIDEVDGTVAVSCLPLAGSSFALGATGVTCTSTDAAHNTTAHTFTIVVVDTTAPVIATHGPDTAEAASHGGAPVTYMPPATTDAVDGPGVATCAPAPGDVFARGPTTVLCDAVDAAGNHADQTHFTVTVRDTTPPVIDSHGSVIAEATGPGGAHVAYAPPGTSDAVDGPGAASCVPDRGSLFPLGPTTVDCDAVDAAGNHAGRTHFTITVVDTTGPAFTAPASQVLQATDPSGAVATWTEPTATDAVDGTDGVSCLPAPGSTFAIGMTTVTCTSTDAAGNTTSKDFRILVAFVDTTGPVFSAPADQTVEATGPSGAVASWDTPTATDSVDGTDPVDCLPASGSTFPLGATTVTCTSTDVANNTTTHAFTIAVVDTTPPAFAAPDDQAITATGRTGAIVTWDAPDATDAVDGTDPVRCLPASGSTFAIGTTTVTCTSADKAGNTTSHGFGVTVTDATADTTPPVIAAHNDLVAEATGHDGAHVMYAEPATSDAVDGPGTATCSPAPGSLFPLGPTTVLCDAVDAAGNHADQTHFTVTVRDTTGPAFTAPTSQVMPATGPSGAVAAWTDPTATDAVDGTDSVHCLPAPGSLFAIGTTTVTCTSGDKAGNSTSHAFSVTVVSTAPVAAPTQAPAANANGWNSTDVVVTWHWSTAGSAIDTAHCTTASASSGQGTLAITATCANVDGLVGSATYTVRVDKTKPLVAITGHPASPSSSSSAAFMFSATDTGGSGIGSVTCMLDRGAPTPCTTATNQGYTGLALGSHTFTVIATDLAGNSSQATYTWCVTAKGPTVSVSHAADGSNGWNRTSPVVLVITVTPGTAAVVKPPTCTDGGHALKVTGSASPYATAVTGDGTHAISCSATDAAGVAGTGTDSVQVDTVAPAITVPSSLTAKTLNPHGVTVSYGATFADATSGLATKACTPASGAVFPVGKTNVTCSATDKAGNGQSQTFVVTVTIQTAIDATRAVLATLKDELRCTWDRDLRKHLSDAIGHVEDSLAANLWVASGPRADGNHLDPANGSKVFDAERAAVDALTGIRNPSAAVKAAITGLVAIDESLAEIAVQDAVAAGADPATIAAAQKLLADGRADLANGCLDSAIDRWKRAWRTATPLPPAIG